MRHLLYDETVKILNERGLTGGSGKQFTVVSLTQLCNNRDIPSDHDRLAPHGMLTLEEIAAQARDSGAHQALARFWLTPTAPLDDR